MSLEEIEKLIDLVARSGVSEVTVRWNGQRVTVRRATVAASAQQPGATQLAQVPAGPAAREAASALMPMESVVGELAERHWISAPMVGIFRHSEPPVGPGMRVEQGQVVGAIESMKLLSDVRADVSGIVCEAAVEAGMAVEYGQPLFAVAAEEP